MALVDVIAAPKEKEKPEEARERLDRWKAPFEHLPAAGDGGRLDASPAALRDLKERCSALIEAATTPVPLRPALTRPLVDAWSLTSLREHPGRPDIGPWLRGWDEDERPQTTVLWRYWLPWRTDENGRSKERPEPKPVDAFFAAARPHLSEMLETETYAVLETLVARASKKAVDLDDLLPALIVLTPAREFRGAFTVGDLRSKDRRVAGKIENDLRFGIAVVSARLGGIDGDGLLDPDAPGFEPDNPDTGWAGCLDRGWDDAAINTAGVRIERHNRVELSEALRKDWKIVHSFAWSPEDEGEDAEHLLVAALRKPGEVDEAGDPAVRRTKQSLAEHSGWIAAEARRIAEVLVLPPDYARMLEIAARLHDQGKARACWQRAMNAPRVGGPYAKTEGPVDRSKMTINGHVYRHEFGSLKDAERDQALHSLPEDLRDLALHLIAAHHGHARPVIAAEDPEAPPSINRERAQAAALRFARLQRRWGPWGLAWWEALLRAADRKASSRLDQQKGAP